MFFLAKKYLLSRKRQTFFILMGIFLGTTAYVIISGLLIGFQQYIIEQLVNNNAHVRISSKEKYIEPEELNEAMFSDVSHVFWKNPPSGRRDYARIEYPEGWFERFDKDPNVIAYSPQISAQVILRRATASKSIKLIGVDPFKQERVTNIRDYMPAGKFFDIGFSYPAPV